MQQKQLRAQNTALGNTTRYRCVGRTIPSIRRTRCRLLKRKLSMIVNNLPVSPYPCWKLDVLQSFEVEDRQDRAIRSGLGRDSVMLLSEILARHLSSESTPSPPATVIVFLA